MIGPLDSVCFVIAKVTTTLVLVLRQSLENCSIMTLNDCVIYENEGEEDVAVR